jgi:ubiquinone biosynthesis accessory factor UbiK
MINSQNLNDLADKLSSVLPDSINTLKSDVKSNMKSVLESSLQQMNLVSREEFDVQTALLARTLQKLKELEKKVEELNASD